MIPRVTSEPGESDAKIEASFWTWLEKTLRDLGYDPDTEDIAYDRLSGLLIRSGIELGFNAAIPEEEIAEFLFGCFFDEATKAIGASWFRKRWEVASKRSRFSPRTRREHH